MVGQRSASRRLRSPQRRGAAAAVAIALALATFAAPPAPAVAQAGDIAGQRAQLQQQEADKAAEIDVLTADADAVDAAITALDNDVAHQQARADDAATRVRALQAELVLARAQQADTEAVLAGLRAELAESALAAYVRPPSENLGVLLGDEDISAAAKRKVLAATRTRSVADVVDELRAAVEQARRAGERATIALAAAESAAAAERLALAALDASRAVQQSLADDVHARLDRALSEAAALAGQSQALADQISLRERQLAGRVGSPSTNRPSWVSSGVNVTTVWGIEVNSAIADNVAALIEAASEDGIYLTGYGFRDIATQIELRMQHCGTSEWAIWEMSSMSCSPPVARPGYSMHEQGLAVDFVVDGDLIRSRWSSAYGWLADNAASYGLYNLPSEPWHWSTTGS